MSLLGRDRERDVIDGVLARARAGESAALVLRGEPGIGKTAVLEYAAETADDALVLRARGIESEVDIAFGGLHALLRPVVEVLDRLPAPQAAALRGALGLAVVDAGERHLVGAATLGLLGVLAEERPVVVLVDDFQWLDGPSAGALVFAARRLLADAVAVVVAARSGEPSAVDGAGLPELELAGLDPEPAHALLAAHAGRPVPRDTAAWLQEATGGNPLALVELAEEAPRLRAATGAKFLRVTPGIRLETDARGDQSRVVTPIEAVRRGADYLVIGRPITGAADPVAALDSNQRSLAEARAA